MLLHFSAAMRIHTNY